jgi:hypothetical protein
VTRLTIDIILRKPPVCKSKKAQTRGRSYVTERLLELLRQTAVHFFRQRVEAIHQIAADRGQVGAATAGPACVPID